MPSPTAKPSCMMHPPSLAPEIKERSFHSTNGELGLLPSDVPAFIDACEQDNIPLLGWEAWIVDHVFDGTKLMRSPGAWSGFIPIAGKFVIYGGPSPREEIRAARCDSEWYSHLRFNVTI